MKRANAPRAIGWRSSSRIRFPKTNDGASAASSPRRQDRKESTMVQMRTILDVADNSGARKVQCTKVLGGSRRRYATVGDVIVVAVKEAIPNAKVKKGEVSRAVIVRTAKELSRDDGSYIRFDGNSAVLLDKEH